MSKKRSIPLLNNKSKYKIIKNLIIVRNKLIFMLVITNIKDFQSKYGDGYVTRSESSCPICKLEEFEIEEEVDEMGISRTRVYSCGSLCFRHFTNVKFMNKPVNSEYHYERINKLSIFLTRYIRKFQS